MDSDEFLSDTETESAFALSEAEEFAMKFQAKSGKKRNKKIKRKQNQKNKR